MSICVYRDGILAADRLLVDEWDHRIGEVSKIFRTKDALYGLVGFWSDYGLFFEWARTSFDPTKRPTLNDGCQALKIDANGVQLSGKRAVFQTIEGPYFAIGSGCHVALGAMLRGASAEEAVECAIELVVSCGGPINVLRLAEQANQYRPDPGIQFPTDAIPDIHFGGPRL